MKPESPDLSKNNSTSIKKLPKPMKILLAMLLVLFLLVIALKLGFYIYCNTVAFCDPLITPSPKMIATVAASEYELAIQEIKEGKYEIAKQRLEYVVRYAPENLDAMEKLLEVEKLLQITPTPTVSKMIQTSTPKSKIPSSSGLLLGCSNTEFSPDKDWVAGYCNNDETWVVGVNQPAKWTISYGDYYGSKFDSGVGDIVPYYWTSDGQHLYLTIQRGVSGPIYFSAGWGLISLDLVNGNFVEILSPIPHQWYSFSLSPDGKYIAYIIQPEKPLKVSIINLETNEIKTFDLQKKYDQAGDILWSPDMSKIVLGQAIVDSEGLKPDTFSVAQINLAKNSHENLVADSSLEIIPKQWAEEDTIEFYGIDGKVWVFNIRDKTLNEKTK
jgi:hypothetical protein